MTIAALRETAIAHRGALSCLAMDRLLRHDTNHLELRAPILGGLETAAGLTAQTIGALHLAASEGLVPAQNFHQSIATVDDAFRAAIAELRAREHADEDNEARDFAQRKDALAQDSMRVCASAARKLHREATRLYDNASEQPSGSRPLRCDALTQIAAIHGSLTLLPNEISGMAVVRRTLDAAPALRRTLTMAVL